MARDEDRHVVDFTRARELKLEEKRRKTERIFFKHLLSIYSVVEKGALFPVEPVDISEDGISFQVPFDPEKPWPKEVADLALRLYFSQDTYLEVRAQVQNTRPAIENHQRFTRIGCTIDKGTQAYTAYQQFVRFLRLYSEHAHKDKGDVTVFYL